MLQKIIKFSLLALLFLLPWQTRWIYEPIFLNGTFWEYGSSSWYGTQILIWLIIILFAIDLLRNRNFPALFSKFHWRSHRRNLFFALGFLLFLGFEVLQSVDLRISYNFFFNLLGAICLFLVISSIKERKPLLLALWSGGVLQGLFGILQFFSQNIPANKWLGLAGQVPSQLGSSVIEFDIERWLRAYGSFGSPNILGGYLAVLFVIGLIIYLTGKPLHKIILTIGQIIILIGLVLSFSRSAWAAALIGIAFIFLTRKPFRRDIFRQTLYYSATVVVLLFFLFPLFTARLNVSSRLEQKSLSERTSQYSEAMNIFNKHPFFGVGPGAYTLALSKEKPNLPAYNYQPVHNVYMLILAEWGIIGVSIWLLIFAWLLSLVRVKNPQFLPVVAIPIVLGAFDHYWWSLYIGIVLWWVVFGLSSKNYVEEV